METPDYILLAFCAVVCLVVVAIFGMGFVDERRDKAAEAQVIYNGPSALHDSEIPDAVRDFITTESKPVVKKTGAKRKASGARKKAASKKPPAKKKTAARKR